MECIRKLSSLRPMRCTGGISKKRESGVAGVGMEDQFFETPDVVGLDPDSYQPYVTSKAASLVMFYNPFKDDCISSGNHFKKAAKNARKSGKMGYGFAGLDCTLYPEFCASQQVHVVPYFRLFTWGRPAENYFYAHQYHYQDMRKWLDSAKKLDPGPTTTEADAENAFADDDMSFMSFSSEFDTITEYSSAASPSRQSRVSVPRVDTYDEDVAVTEAPPQYFGAENVPEVEKDVTVSQEQTYRGTQRKFGPSYDYRLRIPIDPQQPVYRGIMAFSAEDDSISEAEQSTCVPKNVKVPVKDSSRYYTDYTPVAQKVLNWNVKTAHMNCGSQHKTSQYYGPAKRQYADTPGQHTTCDSGYVDDTLLG